MAFESIIVFALLASMGIYDFSDFFGPCYIKFHYPDRKEVVEVGPREIIPCDEGYIGEAHGCDEREVYCTIPAWCLVIFVYPYSFVPKLVGKSETVACGEEYTGVAQGCNETQVECRPKNRVTECVVIFVYPHYGETMTVKAEETKSCSTGYIGVAHGCEQNEVTCIRDEEA